MAANLPAGNRFPAVNCTAAVPAPNSFDAVCLSVSAKPGTQSPLG